MTLVVLLTTRTERTVRQVVGDGGTSDDNLLDSRGGVVQDVHCPVDTKLEGLSALLCVKNVGRAHINCLLRRCATHKRSGHMDELVDTYHTDERLDWSSVNYCVPLKTLDRSEDAISATSTASKRGYFAKTFCRIATLAPRAEPLTR